MREQPIIFVSSIFLSSLCAFAALREINLRCATRSPQFRASILDLVFLSEFVLPISDYAFSSRPFLSTSSCLVTARLCGKAAAAADCCFRASSKSPLANTRGRACRGYDPLFAARSSERLE